MKKFFTITFTNDKIRDGKFPIDELKKLLPDMEYKVSTVSIIEEKWELTIFHDNSEEAVNIAFMIGMYVGTKQLSDRLE